jgi:hypothetical protein
MSSDQLSFHRICSGRIGEQSQFVEAPLCLD